MRRSPLIQRPRDVPGERHSRSSRLLSQRQTWLGCLAEVLNTSSARVRLVSSNGNIADALPGRSVILTDPMKEFFIRRHLVVSIIKQLCKELLDRSYADPSFGFTALITGKNLS